MNGIDAPEMPKISEHAGRVNEPGNHGNKFLKALEGKILERHVRLDIIDIGRYTCMIKIIMIGAGNITLEMIMDGYADKDLPSHF